MNENKWPTEIDPRGFYGLAGDIIHAIAPHTEADKVALLSQLLVAFGNSIGGKPHFIAEADRHCGNIFIVNLGRSSKGRKGSSWGYIARLFELAAPEWKKNNIKSGLASGEGLMWAIRDPIIDPNEKKNVVGVSDKRLLCLEPEFSTILKVIGREGNILSPNLRNAWDGTTMHSLTKNNPIKVTSPHVSLIGHITKAELVKCLNQIEISNGLGNRFLFFCVQRSKCLPEGGSLELRFFDQMAAELRKSIEFAQNVNEIKRDAEATILWREVYPKLSAGKPGIAGALLGRAEAQVMRLSMLTALINKKSEIDKPSLEAGLAIFEYCERSVSYMFGDYLGDAAADSILDELKATPEGLTRTQIRDLFNRNRSKGAINSSLSTLREQGLIECKFIENDGPTPTEVWSVKRTTSTISSDFEHETMPGIFD